MPQLMSVFLSAAPAQSMHVPSEVMDIGGRQLTLPRLVFGGVQMSSTSRTIAVFTALTYSLTVHISSCPTLTPPSQITDRRQRRHGQDSMDKQMQGLLRFKVYHVASRRRLLQAFAQN